MADYATNLSDVLKQQANNNAYGYQNAYAQASLEMQRAQLQSILQARRMIAPEEPVEAFPKYEGTDQIYHDTVVMVEMNIREDLKTFWMRAKAKINGRRRQKILKQQGRLNESKRLRHLREFLFRKGGKKC